MSIEVAFWDASAATPLFVDQHITASALALSRMFSMAVWWGTKVEVRSAIARLSRLRALDDDGQQQAVRLLLNLSRGWLEITPDLPLRDKAEAILSRHPLRAADSLQLAAALTWCQGKPAGRNFLCSDLRLCDAASAEGFTVIQP